MSNSVTAIVPVYNVELYLEDCLSSLVNQKVPLEEIILVNDGSVDRSREICVNYCQEHSNILLISQENQGQGSARNVGLKRAIGDYVIFVDADDYIEANTVQQLKEYLCSYEADILYYNASIQYDIPASEKVMTHSAELDYREMTGKDYLYKAFPESYSSSACLSAYRRKFLRDNNILFPEKIYFEDNLFSMRATLEAKSIYCVPDKFYIRRCRAESTMMGEVSKKKCLDMVSVQHSMWECLQDKKVNIDNIDFTHRFVLAGLLHAIGYLKQASDKIFGEIQIKKLIYSFMEAWLTSLAARKLPFDQAVAFLIILHEIDAWIKAEQMNFISRLWDSQEQYLTMQKKFEEQIKTETTYRMGKLPFYKKNSRIGVYGIGKHTQAVLGIYRKLIGEIRCSLYFIVTKKTCNEFENCPVFNASECGEMVDEIVISSRLYQQEMKETLIGEGIDENKIILLYQSGDICDYTAMEELITENKK